MMNLKTAYCGILALVAAATTATAAVTLDFNVDPAYSGANRLFNGTGGSLIFYFSVDGTGGVTLSASPSSLDANVIAAVASWNGSVGTVTDSALFNTSFTLQAKAFRDGLNGNIVLQGDDTGVLAGQGENSGRIDGASLATPARETIDWTVASGDVQVDFVSWDWGNGAVNSEMMVVDSNSTNSWNSMGVSGSTNLTGIILSSGETISFTQPTNSASGVGLAGIVFDADLSVLLEESSILHTNSNGRLVYHSDAAGNCLADFSHAGYHGGDDPIPSLPVVLEISPLAGDNTAHIQAAIDWVAAMTPDANGHRGAILLRQGTYNVSGIVTINADGIVLRGEGNGSMADDTMVVGTGTAQMAELGIILIQSETTGAIQEPGTRQNVLNEFLPTGSRTIEVENGSGYSVGDYLVIQHDPTEAWLEAINYGNVYGDEVPWVPGQTDLKMYFHGTVTAISGNKVKLDTPIYHPLDRSLSQSVVYRHSGAGIISECGVENMRVISQNAGGTDENHRRDCVHFIDARNCWAKHTISKGFVESGFRFSRSARSTVQNCQAIDPVSIITGGRRYNFYVGGNCHNVLFKDCLATKGRHCFVGNGTATTSGAVFSGCESRNAYASSENHRRWGSGFLWDDIVWSDASTDMVLGMYNRGNEGTSHGWTGTGLVAWNLAAAGKSIACQEPPVGQNYAIGCNATITRGSYPYGFVEGTGGGMSIPSLYDAQLAERQTYGVGPDAPARLRVTHYVNTASPFVALEWDDLALDETSYVLERSANGGASYAAIANLPADREWFTDTTAAQSGSYIYRLKAVNPIGSSAYGNTVAVNLSTEESPAPATCQFEDFSGQSGTSVRWDRHAFTGFGYVDINGTSTWVEMAVDGGMGGSVPMMIRYGGGDTGDRVCAISVNGIQQATATFTSLGSWEVWDTELVLVELERGTNIVRIQPSGLMNGPNLDKMEVYATPIQYAAGETAANAAANAFDGNVNTLWKHHSPYGSWIQSALPAALKVIEYSITSGTGAQANDPKNWTLMGSNDGGATWTILDTRSNELFSARNQTRNFTAASSGDFELYRLEITAVQDPASADSVQLAELQLTDDSLPPTFDSDPVEESNGMECLAYSGTIADNASDPEGDPLTFLKLLGPEWLNVASNGTLSGSPGSGDVGLNTFTVQVSATGGVAAAALEISVDAMPAQLTLDLLKTPGGLANATHVWVFQADGSQVQQTSGGNTFSSVADGLAGSLAGEGAVGSFTVTISSVENFDEISFTNTLSDISGNKWAYNSAVDNYGTLTTTDATIQIQPGEAMLMTFDLSNLTLPSGKQLYVNGFKIQNGSTDIPGGQRISLLEGGATNAVQLTGDSGERNALAGGDAVIQPVGQSVDTGDQIAIWATSTLGQKRFVGFRFSVCGENIEPPSGFAVWAGLYGLSGTPTDDDDEDTLNDFGEYVFGGNPTNGSLDDLTNPSFDISGKYIYLLRGDNSLTVYVLTNADLVAGSWDTNATVSVTSESGNMESYTNTIGTAADQLFIKLKVEQQ
ncbi:discoidin domain-containing protein [Pontiella sulfatireligans]|uniref:Exo-beta-D-glucosaminidase n=1 Tax=Pontiella sulfatireligans TaxID=2750658 RepID=A0A6C2UXG7_9BACT|nr:discoidin domain-containing protein [Pontiella sulfatireligans]VGO23556.1 Exo-beta-D-glucosaminidase [Pontiella sulfatireligans]